MLISRAVIAIRVQALLIRKQLALTLALPGSQQGRARRRGVFAAAAWVCLRQRTRRAGLAADDGGAGLRGAVEDDGAVGAVGGGLLAALGAAALAGGAGGGGSGTAVRKGQVRVRKLFD